MTPEPAGNDNDDNGALVGVSMVVTRLLKATVTRSLVFKTSLRLACRASVFTRGDQFNGGVVSGLVGDAEMRLMSKIVAVTGCQNQEILLIFS